MSLTEIKRETTSTSQQEDVTASDSELADVWGLIRVCMRDSPLRFGSGHVGDRDSVNIARVVYTRRLTGLGEDTFSWKPSAYRKLYVVSSPAEGAHEPEVSRYHYDVFMTDPSSLEIIAVDRHPSEGEIPVDLDPISLCYDVEQDASLGDRAEDATKGGVYDWRKRIDEVRRWRGDSRIGEATAVSELALDIAEGFARYAEARGRSLRRVLHTVIAPLRNGGVHVEWNVREATITHLEVEVHPEGSQRFGLLRTEETREGGTIQAYEVSDATVTEVLANLENLLKKAQSAKVHEKHGG